MVTKKTRLEGDINIAVDQTAARQARSRFAALTQIFEPPDCINTYRFYFGLHLNSARGSASSLPDFMSEEILSGERSTRT